MNLTKTKILGRSLLMILLIKMIYSLIFLIARNVSYLNIDELFSSTISLTDLYGIHLALVLIIIIAPIAEEIMFRGFLSSNKIVISASLIFAMYCLGLSIFNFTKPNYSSIKYALVFLSILIPAGFLWKHKESISNAVIRHKKFSIITSITLFTIFHAFNYDLELWNWRTLLSLLVLLIPYPLIGYVLTTIRLKSGLIWSILLHMISNGLILIPLLLGMMKKF